MTRKVCVITSGRADYGLLKPLITLIVEDESLSLSLVVTGMHLDHAFGYTVRDIQEDGFAVSAEAEVLINSDSPHDINKSISIGVGAFSKIFVELKPDVLVVLGDRYEIFSAVVASVALGLPVAHIHGGEITLGAFDNFYRHAITKMSHIHFAAAEEFEKRIVQMGECPNTVHMVGGLGAYQLKNFKPLGKEEIEKKLGLKFLKKNLLITFHPVTLEPEASIKYLNNLLSVLGELRDTCLIITLPNADTYGSALRRSIRKFEAKHENAFSFEALGQLLYLSCMHYVDGVVGNSSSGLLEAPNVGVGTVNIGSRQNGRPSSRSVINCAPVKLQIKKSVHKLYSKTFRETIKGQNTAYKSGLGYEKILEILRTVELANIIQKDFFDIK